MTVAKTSKQWHVKNWSALGWLETGLKLVAFLAAFLALSQSLSSGTFTAPSGVRLIQVLVLAFLSLGLAGAIFERYIQREIIAMIFVLVNNVAHWGMVYALLTLPGPGSLLLIFTGFMLLGDVVKIVWLRVSGFTQDGRSQTIFYVLTGGFVAGYAIILLLALINP